MIRLNFTPQEIEQFRYQRFHHPHPRVQRKMEALLLKSEGLPHQQICKILGISENTLRAWFEEYLQGGIDRLKRFYDKKPYAAWNDHRDTLEDEFREQPPRTVAEAQKRIAEITGIKRGLTQVRLFLRGLGMKCRKVGAMPAKADVAKQAAFKKNELEPRLKEAAAAKRAVFFVDAAHFVFAPFLGFLWCFRRLFVRAPAGRQRYNVLAALNAITHQLIMVNNDAYINALSVCALLRKLAALNLGNQSRW